MVESLEEIRVFRSKREEELAISMRIVSFVAVDRIRSFIDVMAVGRGFSFVIEAGSETVEGIYRC